MKNNYKIKKYYKTYGLHESNIFDEEISFLEKSHRVKKTVIRSDEIKTDKFVNHIKEFDAYFLAILGAPLIKKKLINAVKGFAINQHAGHSPNYKGGGTIGWALYHRNLKYISNTVHLVNSGADDGPILRRSNVCINKSDSIHNIFIKSVALGTELMIESIKQINNSEEIKVFDQPKHAGNTYLFKEFSDDIILSIINDFKEGWLEVVLNKKP